MEAVLEGCRSDSGREKQAVDPPPESQGVLLNDRKDCLPTAAPIAISASEDTAAAAAAGTAAVAAAERVAQRTAAPVPPAAPRAAAAAEATTAAAEEAAATTGSATTSAASTRETATTAATSADESPGAVSEGGAPRAPREGPIGNAVGGDAPKGPFPLGANLLAVSLAFLELPCLLRCLLVCKLFHEAACLELSKVNKGLVSLELDAFRLTPKGLGALKGAPLKALALAGIEQKDDAFLQGDNALSKLGRSLKRLETLALEIKDERVAVDLAEAAVEASSNTLCRSAAVAAAGAAAAAAAPAARFFCPWFPFCCCLDLATAAGGYAAAATASTPSDASGAWGDLTVGGVSESCLVNLIRKVGAQLHTFSYTRLNVGGAPINDSLLYLCSNRMKGLHVLRLSDALTPRAFPWDLHRSLVKVKVLLDVLQQRPLVSAEGLGRLRPLLGQLKALALNRSCGLPFAVLSDIEVMVFARLHGISDAFVHEALDACGSGAPPRGLHGAPPRKRRRVGGPCFSERLHTWKLKKVSLESSDISDGPELVSLCLKSCHAVSEGGHAVVAACCPNLTALNLGACSGVNDLSVEQLLSGCQNIRTLVLNDARITDSSLETVARCLGPGLCELALHRSDRLTDSGFLSLSLSCPSLKRLSLSKCINVADKGIAEGCRKLMSLRLDGTKTSVFRGLASD
ncbi:hypothetical protein ACSSS7_005126 [Eimeria intestinalis]